MDKITHKMRLANWSKLIQECNESGLSKKSWCEHNQVNEKQFYYWQRRIREEVFSKQEMAASTETATSFVEVPALRQPVEKRLESVSAIIHVNGCSIELSDSASDGFLHRLIGALSYVQ